MPTSDVAAPWPDALRSAVVARVGPDHAREQLDGLGGREVVRLRGPAGSAVLKRGQHERETRFYRDLAPVLDAGVRAPHAYHVDPEWLLLEDVPQPLSRDRWLADSAVMRSLAALHRSRRALAALTDPFLPSWDADQTEAAVDRLDADDRATAARALERLRLEADRWLTGDALVSADPNPRNWGERADGTPVLFDWERVGRATPAVDVAITVPGLPSRDQVELASQAYLAVQQRDHVHWSGAEFTRGLVVVKAWTCVELLADRREVAQLAELQRWLAARLPAWLDAIP